MDKCFLPRRRADNVKIGYLLSVREKITTRREEMFDESKSLRENLNAESEERALIAMSMEHRMCAGSCGYTAEKEMTWHGETVHLCCACWREAMAEIDRTAFGFDPTPCDHGIPGDGCRRCG